VRDGGDSGEAQARLLALLDFDLGREGPVTVVSAPQIDVEAHALHLVRVG